MKDYVSKDMVEKAGKVDLLAYAQSLGYQFETRGRRDVFYQKGSSFNISNNLYYKYSTNEGGNVIQFAMREKGLSFQAAVKELCEWNGEHINTSLAQGYKRNTTEPLQFRAMTLPPKNADYRRAFAYLVKTRKISPEIVSELMHQHKIYENDKHSCVFVGYKGDKPYYASIRSTNTYGKAYKGDVANSNKRCGFVIEGRPGSDSVFVFESPIDAMSHASIMRLQGIDYHDDWRLSLGCTSDGALQEFLKEHKDIKTIYFCTDNDEPGQKVLEDQTDARTGEIKEGYLNKYEHMGYTTINAHSVNKDYNEDLIEYIKLMEQQQEHVAEFEECM